jgi:hypothetical protein
MAICGFLGYNSYDRGGLAWRIKKSSSEILSKWGFPGALTPYPYKGKTFYRLKNSTQSKNTLYIGDSNLEQYYPRINMLIEEDPKKYNGAIFATGGSCPPFPGAYPISNIYQNCLGMFDAAIDLALNDPSIINVVIGGIWYRYLSSDLQGQFRFKSKALGDVSLTNQNLDEIFDGLESVLNRLTSKGKKVYLILNIPFGEELDPKNINKRRLKNFELILVSETHGLNYANFIKKYSTIHTKLLRFSGSDIVIIDPIPFLCVREEFCSNLDEDNLPIYLDRFHLDPNYVKNHVTYIDVTLRSN